MQKIFSVLFAVFIITTSFAQSFEGKIIYSNSFKSKIPGATDQQLTDMMGSVFEYYCKDGSYKTVSNGTFLQWQLHNSGENMIYSKMANSEAAFWNDVSVNPDSVFSAEVHPRVTEILSYTCDELVLKCKSGIQKYYYSSKVPVDPKFFEKHTFGNWYDFVKVSHALPLKSVVESPQFIMESTATKVEPSKVDASLFILPAGIKTEKNPY